MKRLVAILCILIISIPIHAFPGIRYKNKIFWKVDIKKDIVYGRNYQNGKLVDLKMDVYEPHGDKANKRALIICIHGGGFTGGDKSNKYIVYICKDFAKRGYVTASINYRLQQKR